MGLSGKEITLLNFRYQTYLTYISVIWTVAISLLIGLLSYMFFSIEMLNKNLSLLIILSLFLVFVEIAFISVYLWINSKKDNIERIVREN